MPLAMAIEAATGYVSVLPINDLFLKFGYPRLDVRLAQYFLGRLDYLGVVRPGAIIGRAVSVSPDIQLDVFQAKGLFLRRQNLDAIAAFLRAVMG